jgi:arylsulfatase
MAAVEAPPVPAGRDDVHLVRAEHAPLHNLEWDLREEHEIGFPHAWVVHPMAAEAGAFLKTLAAEPPVKPGTPDPYTPPGPGELRPEEHIQIGPIIQYVTALVRSHDGLPDPHHGIEHQTG